MTRPLPAKRLLAGLLLLGGLFASSVLAQPAPTQAGPTRRFALFVGNNQGGEGTRPLLYATDDARRMHEVLVRLGGTSTQDAMLLLDEGADDVLTALGELERRARDARARGERTSLFFYYSGHAKDGALRLGATKLPLESVKARLAQGPTDMRVAVFDACRSGALTRTKGVRKAPAFEVETDATRAAKGLVILTSSASDEDSQESDQIGASYFSYHLASGLLGSADQSGDGRVSLSEAYAYAYERTVASTADSAAGPQHPTFSFDLAGNGDLVLTDVVQRREGLRLPPEAPTGTYFLIDRRGVVVAELVKADGERMIALSPGTYTVKRRLPDRLRVGEVRITEGQVTTLDEGALKNARFADDPVKGTGLSTVYSRHWSVSATGQYQAIFDSPTTAGGLFPSAPMVGGEGTVHNFFGRGFAWSFDAQYGWATGGVATPRLGTAITYRYSLVNVGTSLLYEWNQEGTWVPFLGARLGLSIMNREFDDPSFPRQGFTTMSPGVLFGLKVRLSRSFGLVGRGRVHYLLYNVDETRSLGYAEFGLLLSYEFRD
ncbi:MAG: caspase family protein [Myxococcaceae bacterium]|nr:caspase family protein [Myxococcaceae bacterium]